MEYLWRFKPVKTDGKASVHAPGEFRELSLSSSG